jgi:pimeloyl-ACP methyl ester carboxylesterase
MIGVDMKKIIAAVVLIIIIIILPYFIMNCEDLEINVKVRTESGGKFISLSDGVTYYKKEGHSDKPLLLLIHGYSISSFLWDDVYKSLIRDGEHVLIYDIFGRGYSDKPDGKYNPEMFRKQILELIKSLGIKGKINIAGISMGGAITADFIKHNPDMVNSAIFISPFGIPQELPLNAKLLLVPVIGDYLMAIIGDSVFKKSLKENFYRPLNYLEIQKKFHYQMRFKGYKNALLMTMRNFMQEDFSDCFKSVSENKIPSILIWGKHDAVVPFNMSSRIISLIPDTKFFPLEDLGHTSTLEDPQKITSIIKSFIHEKGKR